MNLLVVDWLRGSAPLALMGNLVIWDVNEVSALTGKIGGLSLR